MGKLRKLIASASVVAVLFSLVVTTGVASAGEWYDAAATWAASAGVIKNLDGLNPTANMTRAEGLKVVVETYGLEGGSGVENPYEDVSGHWVSKEPKSDGNYLQAGLANGVLTSKTKFRPDDPIQRDEWVKMLVEAGGFPACEGVTQFPDVTALGASYWAKDYILTGKCWGLVEGNPDGTFEPSGNTNRAAMVVTAQRADEAPEKGPIAGATAVGEVTPPTPADEPPADEPPADEPPADEPPADEPVVGGGELMVSMNDYVLEGNEVPANATSVKFACWDFKAGDGGAIVKSLTAHKSGVVTLAAANSFYVYDGNDRLTSGRSFNGTTNDVVFNSLNYSVQSGGTATLCLVGDVGATATSGSFSAQLVDAAAVNAGDSVVTGDFPITSDPVTLSSIAGGTVTVTSNGDVAEPKVGQDDVQLAKFKISAATEDASLEKFGLYLGGGTVTVADIQNCELFGSGVDDALATAESSNGKDVMMFVFGTPYAIEKGADKSFTVNCDLNPARSADTILAYVDETTDVVAIGGTYGFGMGVTIAGATGYDGTTCTAANPADCTHSTVQGGDVTITSPGPAAATIGINGKDIVLQEFTIATAGDVTFKNFSIALDMTETAATDGLLDGTTANITDIKVGCGEANETVWGPVDAGSLVTATGGATAITEAAGDDAQSFYKFTEEKVFAAGDEVNCKLTVDVRNLTTLADETIVSTLDLTTTLPEIRDANNKVLTNATSLVPSANIPGKTMTIGSPSLTLNLASVPVAGATEYVKGQTNVKFVGVSAICGTASDCIIKDVTLTGDIDEGGDENSFTAGVDNSINLNSIVGSVWLEDSEGVVVAASKPVQSTGAVNFTNINWLVPAGDTVVFNVVGNASTNGNANATVDSISFGINAASDMTFEDDSGTSRNVTNTINATNAVWAEIIAGGSLTVAVDSGTANENILVAGTANQDVSKFKFTTTKEAFKVTKLSVNAKQSGVTTALIGDNDNNISAIKISYVDSTGATVTKSGTPTNGTVQFSGLDFWIAKDSDAVLTVSASLNEIIEGGGGSTAAEYVDLNLAFNNFESVAQSSGDTYKGDKIDATRTDATDLDFGAITWTATTVADIATDVAITAANATLGVSFPLNVDDNDDASQSEEQYPVGTLFCVDESEGGTCATENIFVVTAFAECTAAATPHASCADALEDVYTVTTIDDAGGTAVTDEAILISLPGTGYLATTNRMYVYKTLPLLAQGATAPSGAKTLSPTDTIFQIAVTPNVKDDVVIRQGLQVDDDSDPLETGIGEGEVVVTDVTVGTHVIDGAAAVKLAPTTIADNDCFLFDRTFTAGTAAGSLGSYKYISFWIKSSETAITYDAIEVIGDDDATCTAGGDDQINAAAANTFVNGTAITSGAQIIGGGTADVWELVTVDIQNAAGAGNTLDTANNTRVGIAIDIAGGTTDVADTDVIYFDGVVLHNEVLYVDLAANAVLDTTPSTVVDCTLKKGTSVIATADVAVQTTSQARLFIVPQDNETGTDYSDIVITKGVANTYDLVCDSQALITQSTNEDLLTPSIDYGSSVDGTVTRGDFWWSADETTRTLVYWLGNVGTKLTGNTLKY